LLLCLLLLTPPSTGAAAELTWVGSVSYSVSGSTPYRNGETVIVESSRFTYPAVGPPSVAIGWTTTSRWTQECLRPGNVWETVEFSIVETGTLTGSTQANGFAVGPLGVGGPFSDGSYSVRPSGVSTFLTRTSTGCSGTTTTTGQWGNGFEAAAAPPGTYTGGPRLHGSAPCRVSVGFACSNRNGAGPGWEGVVSWDLYRCDRTADADADGLGDCRERELGTNPANPDSDGDGLTDGNEVVLGTDPLLSDTDGDGFSDGHEVAGGSDPLDGSSTPTTPPPPPPPPPDPPDPPCPGCEPPPCDPLDPACVPPDLPPPPPPPPPPESRCVGPVDHALHASLPLAPELLQAKLSFTQCFDGTTASVLGPPFPLAHVQDDTPPPIFLEAAFGITFRPGHYEAEVRPQAGGSVEVFATYQFEACVDLLKVADYVAGVRPLLTFAFNRLPLAVKVQLLEVARRNALRIFPTLMGLEKFAPRFIEFIETNVDIWFSELISVVSTGAGLPTDVCLDTWKPSLSILVAPNGDVTRTFTSASGFLAVWWFPA
jgi:hypothetical protein